MLLILLLMLPLDFHAPALGSRGNAGAFIAAALLPAPLRVLFCCGNHRALSDMRRVASFLCPQ